MWKLRPIWQYEPEVWSSDLEGASDTLFDTFNKSVKSKDKWKRYCNGRTDRKINWRIYLKVHATHSFVCDIIWQFNNMVQIYDQDKNLQTDRPTTDKYMDG
jgi:hypothetical protein